MRPRLLRRIGLCVDDFGLHGGVNEAVFGLAALSRVSAFGCLVDGPAFYDDAPVAARLQTGGVAVGLHLDLTEGHAQMARSLHSLIARACLRRLSQAQLRYEVNRQLDAFELAIGAPPNFVDGHQHVHQLPQVRDALLAALLARYPERRPWLRSTRRPVRLTDERFKAGVIERLGGTAFDRMAREKGFAMNRHLLGVYDFVPSPGRYRALIQSWLQVSVDGDLLMCHPSAATDAADSVLSARLDEYQWLAGDGFAHQLANSGVNLDLGLA